MRKLLISLLLLAGVATTASLVFAGDFESFPNGREPLYHGSHSSIQKYSNSLNSSFGYGDSTYIGYSPGNGSAANPWSIRSSITNAGTTNVHRPPKAGCMWNWDPEEASGNGFINGDSLQGWWPIRMQWRYLGQSSAGVGPDYAEPATGLDYGNQTNYYPVQGRTTGVIGVWHRDQGGDITGTGTALNGAASNGVTWVPLQGQQSAWCGLRAHLDATAPKDAITGVPFDADAARWNVHIRYSGAVAVPKFPGYVDQWDQMLYRDIDMSATPAGDLTLGFTYSTRMSVTPDLAGWFDKDPLAVTSDGLVNCAAGNFISTWDTDYNSPADSFMVYVGQPTDGTFQQFNGSCTPAVGRAPIYDPLRRWFDEVVEANDPGKVIELVSAAGNDSAHVVSGLLIPNSQIAPILAASGGKIRLVFRVKTNSQVSDVTNGAYNSRGRGAAQVDNVTYAISGGASNPAGWGDFEAAGSINNSGTALAAWRSTGKPPTVMTHREKLGNPGVPYDDLCGSDPAAVGRVCSMNGGIIVFGEHDLGDAIGNPINYQSDHEVANGIMSPTIQLRSNNGSWPNTIGVTAPGNPGDAIATNDMMIDYETFTKGATANAPPVGTGITYRWLVQLYPQLTGGNAPSANVKQWGNLIRSFANYQTDAICFRSLPGITGQEGTALALGMVTGKFSASAAENANYPDSIRIGWQMESTCYTTGVNACNPIGGLYIDNLSLVLIDGTALPLSGEIWNWYQTSFPWNEAVTPQLSAAFDTAAILVKTGLDIGPADGANSYDVPGDSIVAAAAGVSPIRVDLVFRVLPGPGNYRIVGNSASGLTPSPSAGIPTSGVGRAAVVANVASSNFWETFLANNGPFGTAGGHPGGVWSANVWNSARADTSEANIFPRSVGTPTAQSWQSTYHDIELGIGAGDAYSGSTVVRSGIGILRHKCFVASATANVTDIDCEHNPPAAGAGYDLSYVVATGSGYDGNATTKEGTKIFPDGLLTPGAHVEYFWRKAENGSTAMTGMMPDTSTVVPQLGERNNDGHRFAGFGALPDRWKQGGYSHPIGISTGSPACMLVVNDQTTNGYDWLCWSGVADTIGATSNQKWGAEVGWHAKGGGADINQAANNVDRAGRPGFIAEHGGNPGSTWDGYQIIGAEDTAPAGSFGARYAHADASNTQIDGKRQQGTPTLEQLKAFYKIILWFTGNLNAFTMGPSGDRGSDDQQLLKDWLLSGSPASLNRVLWNMGDGYVESNEKETDLTKQPDLDLNYLGVELRNGQYRLESNNARTTITMTPASGPMADGTVYGVRNTCTHSNDVLKVGVGGVTALSSVFTNYEDPNTADAVTYPASILKTFSAAKPWAAVTEGYSIMDLMNRFGADTRGRSKYFFNVLTKVFGTVCSTTGTPIVPLDVPNLSEGNVLADFVNLRNANPLSSGTAKVAFGISKDDRVSIRVFDVTGREIKLLADRQFAAGEHTVIWDGTDNGGRPVARGVYFTQVKYRDSGFSDAKKLTVLKN